MKNRIFVKLFAAALLIIAVCALTMNVLIQKAWEDMLRNEIETSLRQKTLLFASRIADTPPGSVRDVTARVAQLLGARATVVDSSGKVLADSEIGPRLHAQRGCTPGNCCGPARTCW